MSDKNNLVKEVCKELNITQKELAQIMGVSDSTVRGWASNKEISQPMENFLNCLLENHTQKEKLVKFQTAFKLIDEAKK